MKRFFDSLGKEIRENDIICFKNKHKYKCIVKNDDLIIECLSIKLPLIKLDKICMNNILVSAKIIE